MAIALLFPPLLCFRSFTPSRLCRAWAEDAVVATRSSRLERVSPNNSPTQCRRSRPLRRKGGSSFEGDFSEIIERHGADDLQALRAQLIHRVSARVPGWEIKIDQIDRGNADRIKRRVVVDDLVAVVGEMVAHLQGI